MSRHVGAAVVPPELSSELFAPLEAARRNSRIGTEIKAGTLGVRAIFIHHDIFDTINIQTGLRALGQAHTPAGRAGVGL